MRGETLAGSTLNLSHILLKLGIASVILVGAYLLADGTIPMLTYLIFLIVSASIYNPIMEVMNSFAALLYLDVRINRFREMDQMPIQTGVQECHPKGFDIAFDGVEFSYETGKQVLRGVSFVARQGEVTALVGPSGGGKSTTAKLAARFWDVNQGRITLGGEDISKIDPETLLQYYSVVFQDVLLFNASIADNIRVGRKDASDEEVRRVARLAQCEEFIQRMPQGYDTQIGENGETLSGGERQRISIARALLKDAPIVLLDEATASLDVENESKIQTAISALIKDKTVLLIELCMRTGLMPSNRLYQKFFTHSRLAMQLTDAAGTPVFVSAARTRAPQRDIRTARMEVDGGALLWQEDLSLLHEQQRRLTLTRDTLLRARRVLREEHTIRKRLLRLILRRQLSEELEAILAAKRPLLRAFREQLMATDDAATVTLLIRRLNLLSSYLKKRCVLFLKGQEDGYIRADELSMAVSETCTYLRPLGLRVGVEWAQQESLPEADALALFDFFAEFLARAAREETADAFCRFADGTLTFLLEPADWIAPWTADWQEHHAVRVALADRGYALSLRVRPAPAETEEAAADDAAACAAGGSSAHAQACEPRAAETEGSSWNG